MVPRNFGKDILRYFSTQKKNKYLKGTDSFFIFFPTPARISFSLQALTCNLITHQTWQRGGLVAWSLQGSNFLGECALVREEPAGGARDPGTRRGPRPLPEQQPGTGPPSLTPANRRRTPSGATSPRGRQRLAGAGAALARRGPLGSPGKPWQAPPRRKGPRSGSEAGPRTWARGPQRRSPKDGGWPERAAARQGGRQAPRLRPRGPRPGRAPAGRARTPARPGLAPPRPLSPGPFIGQPHPCQRGGDRVAAGKTSPPGPGRKIKS